MAKLRKRLPESVAINFLDYGSGVDAMATDSDGNVTYYQVKYTAKQSRRPNAWVSQKRRLLASWLLGLGGAFGVAASLTGNGFLNAAFECAMGPGFVLAAIDIVAAILRGPAKLKLIAGSVRSLTSLAAFLAGREGRALLEESDSHLAGWDGRDPVSWQKLKQAAGFVKAGVEYRYLNITEAAWRPIDAVLGSRS